MSARLEELSLPVEGMCCAEEAEQVEAALRGVPGVSQVEALLGAERVRIRFDGGRAAPEALADAVGRDVGRACPTWRSC